MSDPRKVPVFILAGGLGTRLSEETQLKPKPMVEIGDFPILIHIMRHYYRYGFDNFVICAGYRSFEIKNFFMNYPLRANHIDLDHRVSVTEGPAFLGRASAQEKWRVRVIDTGNDCMTGGRIARALDLISPTESFDTFAVTYGDGLSDVDLAKEFAFHLSHQKLGTVLAVNPLGRFGVLKLSDGMVSEFLEKPEVGDDYISGGFFFFQRNFREYLEASSQCILERSPLSKLAQTSQLAAYCHRGFWQPMDTLRDRIYLEELWRSGKAPWVV